MYEDPVIMRRHAQTCRRLAQTEASLEAAETLLKLASEYETQAQRVERQTAAKVVTETL
jgi:hypothetical protein